MPTPRILVFAGSARRESLNKKLARVAAAQAEGMPANALKLRTLFMSHDALAIASPENNQSITALLKNTTDWLSRGIGDESGLAPYRGKVAALLAASPGPFGGVRHLPHLRQSLGALGVVVLARSSRSRAPTRRSTSRGN